MSVSNYFEIFCGNLRMSNTTISNIQGRYNQITKRINSAYWHSDSAVNHSLYGGSYGRGTDIFASDIDMIVELPALIYHKYKRYAGNGQSAFLQEVKSVLQKNISFI
ncbi:SMODS domain-containing nucleotidyltransferase [Clostridium gasigenes]|uniref:SMODS domain-containing nucleotidyltransferase n=1 Tax=Clostridium gasigenes TaxID=94869 RepID=UPI00209B90F4|nr:hypothetical protein [Clostridium gasigenes]